MREKLVGWGAMAGVLAGASFAAGSLLGFIGSDTFLEWFGSDSSLDLSSLYDQVEGLDFPVQAVTAGVGLVLMVGVLGAVQARRSNVLGRIGLFASLAGVILLLSGILMASLSSAALAGWIPVYSWEWYVALLAFTAGLPLTGLGLVISIVATLRARGLPGWARFGFAALLTVALLGLVVEVALGMAHDRVEESYIQGDRSLGSYTTISRTLDMWEDVLGLAEGVVFGLAWVVLGLALLSNELEVDRRTPEQRDGLYG